MFSLVTTIILEEESEPAQLRAIHKPYAPERHARPDRAPHYQERYRTRVCDSSRLAGLK